MRTIQSNIMKFVWRGRPPKVAAKVICQNIAGGGLGMLQVGDMYTSLKLGWVKKKNVTGYSLGEITPSENRPIQTRTSVKM